MVTQFKRQGRSFTQDHTDAGGPCA
jgi:hypothetical protein